MCCISNIIGKVVSHLLYFSEKFVYCFTCSALVSCLVTTILVTLGMGIGIGYNYCFVDFKTRHRYVPARHYKYYPDKKYHPDNRYYPEYHPGNRYPPGYHPDNRYPPGYHPDNIYPPGYHPDDRYPPGYHPDNRYPPGYYPDNRYPPEYQPDNRHPPGYDPDYTKYPDLHWKRSTPTYVTASGVTDNVNDLQVTDNSILTRNENETQSHFNTNNTKQFYNKINYETIENMQENKDQVRQTNKQTKTEKLPDDSPNLIVPISGLDLIALLSKFRSENRNYSLQIVTT